MFSYQQLHTSFRLPLDRSRQSTVIFCCRTNKIKNGRIQRKTKPLEVTGRYMVLPYLGA